MRSARIYPRTSKSELGDSSVKVLFLDCGSLKKGLQPHEKHVSIFLIRGSIVE
jgi:hypothetical protein